MKKENLIQNNYLIFSLILITFLSRLFMVFFLRDTHLENEWQTLLNNLINYKSYSFYTFKDQLIPSAYMPPAYPFFLYLIYLVTNFLNIGLLNTVIFIQILLSTYSVYIFYQINLNFFFKKVSLFNSFIFSLIPLNIYYCGQISSINLQLLLSLLFLKFLILFINKEKIINLIIFSVISGLLILTRGEFILIFILTVLYILLCKKIKLLNLIKISLIVILITSPYVIRNYIHFGQFFFVKSLGYNLWKGNNNLSTVQGYEDLRNLEFSKINNKLKMIEKNSTYEIARDKVFLGEAVSNIKEKPFVYIKLYIKKLFSYYFIDLNSNYPNYYNIFHILPILLLSIFSFPGIFTFLGEKSFEKRSLGLYLISNLLIFSIFFILPRYKLIILPIQLILAANFITYIMKKYGIK